MDYFLLLCMWKNQGNEGRVFSHFSRRWITNLLTHGQIEIKTLSGKTAQMGMLAWSFSARICVKYLNHMNWYDQFGLSLHLHSLLFSATSKGSGETVRMCILAWSFTAQICDKKLNHMNWYEQFGLSIQLHPFFLMHQQRLLRDCANVRARLVFHCSDMR